MSDSIVLDKAIKFALRIVRLYKYLTEEKREYVLSKLRDGDFLSEEQHSSVNADCLEMIKLTSSISKSTRENE